MHANKHDSGGEKLRQPERAENRERSEEHLLPVMGDHDMCRDSNIVSTGSFYVPHEARGPSAEGRGRDEGEVRAKERKTQAAGGVGEPAPEGPRQEGVTCQKLQPAWPWGLSPVMSGIKCSKRRGRGTQGWGFQ